jgi:hypothetical protein
MNAPNERITAMAETQSKTTSKPSASPQGGDHDTETIALSARPADRPGDVPQRVVAGDATYAPELAADIPMRDGRVIPTPGDVRTEPVATAEQSHVAGRVGPRTVAQDATSAQPAGDALDEVLPGTVLADTPEGSGPVPIEQPEDPIGEGLNRVAERVEAAKQAREIATDRYGTTSA